MSASEPSVLFILSVCKLQKDYAVSTASHVRRLFAIFYSLQLNRVIAVQFSVAQEAAAQQPADLAGLARWLGVNSGRDCFNLPQIGYCRDGISPFDFCTGSSVHRL